jgi:hypothetical protein
MPIKLTAIMQAFYATFCRVTGYCSTILQTEYAYFLKSCNYHLLCIDHFGGRNNKALREVAKASALIIKTKFTSCFLTKQPAYSDQKLFLPLLHKQSFVDPYNYGFSISDHDRYMWFYTVTKSGPFLYSRFKTHSRLFL